MKSRKFFFVSERPYDCFDVPKNDRIYASYGFLFPFFSMINRTTLAEFFYYAKDIDEEIWLIKCSDFRRLLRGSFLMCFFFIQSIFDDRINSF